VLWLSKTRSGDGHFFTPHTGVPNHSSPAQAGTCRRNRDPLVPGAQRVPGNEAASGWADFSKPDDHGVEWLALALPTAPARPTSLAHLGRRASEKKWPEAWSETPQGYVLRKKGKPARPQPGRRSEQPRGSTSSSPGMPSRVCTWRARVTDRTTTAGGVTRRMTVALTRRETTCLSTVTSGKTNRP